MDQSFCVAKLLNNVQKFWSKYCEDSKVFYDNQLKRLVFFKDQCLFIVFLQNISRCEKIRVNMQNVYQLVIDQDFIFIALQFAVNKINIINLETQKDHILTIQNKSSKLQTILKIEFLEKNPKYQLVVIESFGIHLYKFSQNQQNFKEAKIIGINISACWFVPNFQILATTYYQSQQQGLVHIYYLNLQISKDATMSQNADNIFLKGPQLILNINTQNQNEQQQVFSGMEKISQFLKSSANFLINQQEQNNSQNAQFLPIGDNRNIDLSNQNFNSTNFYQKNHQILVSCIYNVPYLIHLNSPQGLLYFYELSKLQQKGSQNSLIIQPKLLIKVPSDGFYQLSIVDNLLLVHNQIEHLSMLYDIQRYNYQFSISLPSEISILNTEKYLKLNLNKLEENYELNSEQKQDQNDEFDFSNNNLLYSQTDNQLINFSSDSPITIENKILNQNESNQQKTPPKQLNQNQILYNNEIKLLGDNFAIIVSQKYLIKFKLDLTQVFNLIEDEMEAFFLLSRREGCKKLILQKIYQMICDKKPIMNLHLIFRELSDAYKNYLLQEMVDNQYQLNKSQDLRQQFTKLFEMKENIEYAVLKDLHSSFNGRVVILQSEIVDQVFFPDFENNEHEYLKNVILTYVRTLIDNDFLIQPSLLSLIIKLFKNNLLLIHYLLQFSVLQDNFQLSYQIIQMSDNYPAFYQLGLDMLHRLNKKLDIVQVLFDKGKCFSALNYIKSNELREVPLKIIVDGIKNPKSDIILKEAVEFVISLQQFFTSFTFDNFMDEINKFEQQKNPNLL